MKSLGFLLWSLPGILGIAPGLYEPPECRPRSIWIRPRGLRTLKAPMDGSVYAKLVQALATDAQQRTLEAVVKTLQSQPSALAGEDSGLGNIWLQYAVQIQGELKLKLDLP